MRFCSLGSGSSGNATLIEARSITKVTRVLVDCGFALKELTRRLARRGLGPDNLDALFITHEHGDHVGCALALSRRHQVPVWMSRGTWLAIGSPLMAAGPLHFARDGELSEIGDIGLTPYTVPHDAAEPLQLTVSDGVSKLGLLTDAGSLTAHLRQALERCTGILLECNHDSSLLAASSYHASLKARVGGPLGHLANHVAAQLLAECRHTGLRHVVAAHLSLQNNRPELAATALAGALETGRDDIIVADAALGFDWLGLN